MKKIQVAIVLLSFFIGCSENNDGVSTADKTDYKKIAYESLSEQSKSTVENWESGKVDEGTCLLQNGDRLFEKDSSIAVQFVVYSSDTKLHNGQKLVAVTFTTTVDSLLGPMILIIDPEKKQVIGGVLRL